MKYGRLTLIEKLPNDRGLFRCDCGVERSINRFNVFHGRQVSCGCQRADNNRERGKRLLVHGMKGTKEYKAWRSMRERCFNPNNSNYHRYGARGITVAPEWCVIGGAGFLAFLSEIGPCPDKSLSIDRIDNDGNYEPGNVRWATVREQGLNREATRYATIDGEKIPVALAADRNGLSRNTVHIRIRAGWPVDEAVSRPSRQRGRP